MTAARPVALVTGATSGIGKAAALALVEAGFDVVGTSRDTTGVSRRDGVTFLDLDVADDASVTAAVERVIDQFGRIDVLVNNAGVGSVGRRRGTLDRAGPERVRHQRLRRHPHDEGRPAAHACPAKRPHHQHLVGAGVRPRALHGRRTPRPSTRSRATPSPWTTRSASTAYGCCSSSPATPAPRSTRTPRSPTAPLPVYAEQRRVFDDVMAAGDAATATIPPSSPGRSSRPRPTRSRSCATPPAPRPAASARCAASPPPGPSTSRSASSTGSPVDRRRRPHHRGAHDEGVRRRPLQARRREQPTCRTPSVGDHDVLVEIHAAGVNPLDSRSGTASSS